MCAARAPQRTRYRIGGPPKRRGDQLLLGRCLLALLCLRGLAALGDALRLGLLLVLALLLQRALFLQLALSRELAHRLAFLGRTHPVLSVGALPTVQAGQAARSLLKPRMRRRAVRIAQLFDGCLDPLGERLPGGEGRLARLDRDRMADEDADPR